MGDFKFNYAKGGGLQFKIQQPIVASNTPEGHHSYTRRWCGYLVAGGGVGPRCVGAERNAGHPFHEHPLAIVKTALPSSTSPKHVLGTYIRCPQRKKRKKNAGTNLYGDAIVSGGSRGRKGNHPRDRDRRTRRSARHCCTVTRIQPSDIRATDRLAHAAIAIPPNEGGHHQHKTMHLAG